MGRKRVLDAQDVWMKNQRNKFWKDRLSYLYVLILIGCFLVVAWIEVPY